MAQPDTQDDVGTDEQCDLSLQEAARLYEVSLTTLRRRVRRGEVRASKVRGPWGPEWRVSRRALEDLGMRARPVLADGAEHPRIVELEREVASLRRVVAVERLRADRADQELGFAMLESGRLRAALARATEAR